jgi:hypothetical protein
LLIAAFGRSVLLALRASFGNRYRGFGVAGACCFLVGLLVGLLAPVVSCCNRYREFSLGLYFYIH